MQTNLNLQTLQQNFGMAIRADERAINKLSEVVNETNLNKLQSLISYQKNKATDIFLSTDKLNNLTAKVGFAPAITESPKMDAIQVIDNATRLIEKFELNSAMKSWEKLQETVNSKGLEAGINETLNRLKIDA